MNSPPPASVLRVLLSADQIRERVMALGSQLTHDYAGVSELRVIGILKGAWVFFADLVRQIELPVTCDFIGASSYGRQMMYSGHTRFNFGLTEPVTGMDVLLVEDIIDTGHTIQGLYEALGRQFPRRMRTCTLLDKPSRRRVAFTPDYVGFTIPDHFVVGYGLDFAGAYRHLPHIAIYKES